MPISQHRREIELSFLQPAKHTVSLCTDLGKLVRNVATWDLTLQAQQLAASGSESRWGNAVVARKAMDNALARLCVVYDYQIMGTAGAMGLKYGDTLQVGVAITASGYCSILRQFTEAGLCCRCS